MGVGVGGLRVAGWEMMWVGGGGSYIKIHFEFKSNKRVICFKNAVFLLFVF